MEALQFTLKDKKLELVKKPIPIITDSRCVLIKIVYSGICGTDLHILQGEYPCQTNGALIMGHEFCGTIVDVGSEVMFIKKGDRVAVDPSRGCGVCHQCHSADPHYCLTNTTVPGMSNTLGIFRSGGWAEYAVVPENKVFKLPDNISLEQAVLAEPLSCIAHGWDKISPVTVGQKILVNGAGIIGNLWVSVLHLQGHRNVTVSEPNPTRRQLVQNLSKILAKIVPGKIKFLDTNFNIITPKQLQQRAKDSTYLFDLVIDCSGFAPAIEQALSLLHSGGKLCIFGVAPPQDTVKIAPYAIYQKELTVLGVYINPFSFYKSLGLLSALGERYLKYDDLGIDTFSLKDYQKAFEKLKKGVISKAVFRF